MDLFCFQNPVAENTLDKLSFLLENEQGLCGIKKCLVKEKQGNEIRL